MDTSTATTEASLVMTDFAIGTTLADYVPMADEIETFWPRGDQQAARTWREHREINAVTPATSLVPDEFPAA